MAHFGNFIKQCCGSVTFCYGSVTGSGSCFSRQWLTRCQSFLFKLFLPNSFWRYIYISFIDIKSKRSHKSRFILLFLLVYGIQIHIKYWRIQEAQKHMERIRTLGLKPSQPMLPPVRCAPLSSSTDERNTKYKHLSCPSVNSSLRVV